MRFINYCIVIMGDTKNVFSEIEKISETPPNILDAKGILIATFVSALKPNELTDWFKVNKRSFLLFDLDSRVSGFNIIKKEIENGLFGFIKKDEVNLKSDSLIRAIELTSDTRNIKTSVKKIKPKELDVNNMTLNEREDMLNKIMDKGLNNLSETDKKLLQRLAK